MPQLQDRSSIQNRPLLLAQGETHSEGVSADAPAGETHAATEHGGHKQPQVGSIPPPDLLFMNSVMVAVLLVVFAFLARRKLVAVPKVMSLQNVAEMMVEYVNALTVGIIGPHGRKYTPLIGTLFFYILFMNLIGQVPGFHSPTANLSITFALGITVFFIVQYEGIRSNGLIGHIKHFMGPMLAIAPLMFLIEVVSELIKPLTLSVRLFGNIFGEDVVILVLAGLIKPGDIGFIPIQFPIMMLALLSSTVQALVFSMLTCIYIALVTHHEHEEAHGESAAHDAEHAPAASH